LKITANLRFRIDITTKVDKMFSGCWMLDAGCWMLDAGCWMLDAGCVGIEIREIRVFFQTLQTL
jgi:hypothetical protein